MSRSRAFIWLGLALIPSSPFWEPRPHAFSLLFIVVTVGLLARRRLWWLPLVFIVWANCHGGVLLGFVLLGTGLGVQTLVTPGTWRQAVLVFLACMVAATATPLGLSFWSEIPSHRHASSCIQWTSGARQACWRPG